LENVEHGTGDAWHLKWNSLFDFSHFENHERIPNPYSTRTLFGFLASLLWSVLSGRREISVSHAHWYTDVFPAELYKVLPEIRQRSRISPDRNSSNPEIAVHLRRGFGAHERKIEFTPDRKFEWIIETLTTRYPGTPIRVFTGKPEPDLQARLPKNVIFDFESSVFEVVEMCSRATVFVMAKSSLSYVAGLLNENAVVFEKFWSPPMEAWRSLEEFMADDSFR
jgi:hypothetical protein